MGGLHEGHLSLVRRSADENDVTAASVFVNPTQFGPTEDLDSYPRDLARDQAMLQAAGCDLVFAPQPSEMYAPDHQTWVEVGAVAEPLEGMHRPGHFRGVTTVVAKLFGIVQPTRAYFGEKDAQQLAVISRMVRDLDMPVEIVPCPTVREPDGLAMSTRNTYLTAEERAAATVLYRALVAAQSLWENGEDDADVLRAEMLATLSAEPLADVEYVSVADSASMEEVNAVVGPTTMLMAVRIGKTRLIDNMRIGSTDRDLA
jgi:pantoate--beta-alanine ligase